MRSNKRSRLEKLVEEHHNTGHHDPLDLISNHVIMIVFISLLFLGSVFVFLTSVPSDSHATAYAIVEFKAPDFAFMDNVSAFLETIRLSNDQPYFLLTMFVAWIMVVGLINIALHERELNRKRP
ncbi:hypothetical protein JXB31_01860 [Candidatus Woesearchaeota archaeon]|nr:hypothetical protein [Candidatus Woesearchaeota archaeon]